MSEDDVPEGFRPFEKGQRAFKSSTFAVRITSAGSDQLQFLFSPDVHEFMGEPEAVRYYYKESSDQIAFAPVQQDHPQGYSVGNRTCSATGILHALGIDTDDNWFLEATKDEDRGWILVDLSDIREDMEENDE